MDAQGDGEVLVVMDLRPDEELLAAGAAREVGGRATWAAGHGRGGREGGGEGSGVGVLNQGK